MLFVCLHSRGPERLWVPLLAEHTPTCASGLCVVGRILQTGSSLGQGPTFTCEAPRAELGTEEHARGEAHRLDPGFSLPFSTLADTWVGAEA